MVITLLVRRCAEKYLGDRRLSYNSLLTFTLYLDDDHDDVAASRRDVVLDGGGGLSVGAPIYAQNNPTPGRRSQLYRFRLSEHESYRWTPRLSVGDFVRLLSNVTAVKIRARYSARGIHHRVKYIFYLESIRPIRTAENFEAVEWASGFSNKHGCIVGL